MSEIVLSSSSDSVDKAIDEYTDPVVLAVLAIATVVVVIAVVRETLRTSMNPASLGFFWKLFRKGLGRDLSQVLRLAQVLPRPPTRTRLR